MKKTRPQSPFAKRPGLAKLLKKFRFCKTNIGWRIVEIWLDPKTRGGTVLFLPKGENTPPTAVNIGIQVSRPEAWATLIHELMEMILCDLRVRFKISGAWADSTGDCYFFFDHVAFDEATTQLGYFISKYHSDFDKAWTKANLAAQLEQRHQARSVKSKAQAKKVPASRPAA